MTTTGTATLFEGNKPEVLDNLLRCNDYYARLFANDLDLNSPIFTECNFLGYSSKKLDKSFWNASTREGARIVSYYKEPVVWNCDDSDTKIIRGYYVTNDSNNVIWYYKFPSPVFITNLQAISLTLRIVLGCN